MDKNPAVPEQNAFESYLSSLIEKLKPGYAPRAMGTGGHDFTHVERLIAIGKTIRGKTKIDFDWNEFVTAVWLHNLDRAPAFRKDIERYGKTWALANEDSLREYGADNEDVKAFVRARGLEFYCYELLEPSPFGPEARERIVKAVMEHPKFKDEPGNSTLLTALRIADKVDRMGPLGIMASGAFRGKDVLPYDSEHPFGYGSTEEGRMKTLYDDLFRVMEWFGMLPSDEARSVVNERYFWFFISYVRMLGEEIAERTGTHNTVELDIQRALGGYYDRFVRKAPEPSAMHEVYDHHPHLQK